MELSVGGVILPDYSDYGDMKARAVVRACSIRPFTRRFYEYHEVRAESLPGPFLVSPSQGGVFIRWLGVYKACPFSCSCCSVSSAYKMYYIDSADLVMVV